MRSDIRAEDALGVAKRLKDVLAGMDGATVLIAGAAGFVGSLMVETLISWNELVSGGRIRVVALDNFRTGRTERFDRWKVQRDVLCLEADVRHPLQSVPTVDFAVHAASPVTGRDFIENPVETIETNVLGTYNLLAASAKSRAFLLLSSSEVYGDPPPEHIPTPEDYPGNVSTIGPRSAYDEGKRLAESLCVAYHRQSGLRVRIARLFNFYGPGLNPADGRAIPSMITEALSDGKITLHSDGTSTRTFCYVADGVEGLLRALCSERDLLVVNIGAPGPEVTMSDLARRIAQMCGNARIRHVLPQNPLLLQDCPRRRCPDITRARTLLNLEPRIVLDEGLWRSRRYFEEVLEQ